MGAVAGAVDIFALGEQCFDFLLSEGVSGLDGRFTRHHIEQLMEQLLAADLACLGDEQVEQVADEFSGAHAFEQGRKALDGDGAGSERLKQDAEAL